MYKTAIYTFNTSTSVASSFNNKEADASDTIDSFQTLINRSLKNKLNLKETEELDNNLTIKSVGVDRIVEDSNLDPNYFTTNFSADDTNHGTMVINSDTDQSSSLKGVLSDLNDSNVLRGLIGKEVKQYDREHCLGLNLTRKEIENRLNLMYSQMNVELEQLKVEFDKKRDLILQAIEIKKNSVQVF